MIYFFFSSVKLTSFIAFNLILHFFCPASPVIERSNREFTSSILVIIDLIFAKEKKNAIAIQKKTKKKKRFLEWEKKITVNNHITCLSYSQGVLLTHQRPKQRNKINSITKEILFGINKLLYICRLFNEDIRFIYRKRIALQFN